MTMKEIRKINDVPHYKHLIKEFLKKRREWEKLDEKLRELERGS